MQTEKIFKRSAFLIVIAALSFAACKRSDSTTTSNTADPSGVTYAADESKMERDNNDVESIADEAVNTGGSDLRTTATTVSNCATVSNDTVNHILTINFGTANCTCLDGRNRRGEIIVQYTGHYKDSGSVHTFTFNNYFVDDNQLTGSKTVTNMGANSDGNVYYDISVNDSLILGSNNGTISWTSTRTRTWLQGYSTAQRSDDVWQIAGSATIIHPNGDTTTVAITTPLQIAASCMWIESGVVQMTRPNGTVRSINYGNGNCDREAQLTVNGHTYNITIN